MKIYTIKRDKSTFNEILSQESYDKLVASKSKFELINEDEKVSELDFGRDGKPENVK